MIKNIQLLMMAALLFTATPVMAQSWWWGKKNDTAKQEVQKKEKPSVFNRQGTTPQQPKNRLYSAQNIQKTITAYQKNMVSFDRLDSVVANTRAANFKNAQSYAQKQQAKIAREERARKAKQARLKQQQSLQAETAKSTTKKKKRYIYKPKTSGTKKPARVFNTIE